MKLNKLSRNTVIIAAVALSLGYTAGVFTSKEQPKDSQNIQVEQHSRSTTQQSSSTSNNTQDDIGVIAQAFEQQRHDVQVGSSGEVVAVLADDNKGSRHQRFLLELSNGQTVLVAHNIDLAARIDDLQKGDQVEFYGVYEYNPKGGVIHWTHHDPDGQHIAGWLKHQGQTYQ